MVRDLANERQLVKNWPAEGLTLEHIDVTGEGPLTFHSEKQLRRYCRKHQLNSGALL